MHHTGLQRLFFFPGGDLTDCQAWVSEPVGPLLAHQLVEII